MQILKNKEMEFVSEEFGISLPPSPSVSASGFFSAQGPRVAAPQLPLSSASRGGFYCDQKVGLLGVPWESLSRLLGKLWVHFPAPAPPILSVPAFFQKCIVSDELPVCFKGRANLCKRVCSFLPGADGSSVWEPKLGSSLITPYCTNFCSPGLAGLSGIGS